MDDKRTSEPPHHVNCSCWVCNGQSVSSTSEPGLPHGILCQCPKCLPSSGGTPVSKLLEVVCPACGYDFPPRVANYPNAHCPNCRHDFNYAVTNAAPSEPPASEPRTYKGDLHKDLLDDDFALE